MEARRVGAQASVLLTALVSGCCHTGAVSAPPPCPTFGSEAITDYVRILEWEDTATIGRVDSLHEWIEEQATYCTGIEAYRESLE